MRIGSGEEDEEAEVEKNVLPTLRETEVWPDARGCAAFSSSSGLTGLTEYGSVSPRNHCKSDLVQIQLHSARRTVQVPIEVAAELRWSISRSVAVCSKGREPGSRILSSTNVQKSNCNRWGLEDFSTVLAWRPNPVQHRRVSIVQHKRA